MIAHAFDPSTPEAEEDVSQELVPGHNPELQRNSISKGGGMVE